MEIGRASLGRGRRKETRYSVSVVPIRNVETGFERTRRQ
jgi:hypothetical protein